MGHSTLDREFWTKYLNEHRNKKPMIGRGILKNLPDDATLLRGLRRATEASLLHGKGYAHCFADGHEVQSLEASESFIPRTEDFDTYTATLSEKLGTDNFCMVINEFVTYCPELWECLKDIDAFIKKALGFPAGIFETTVFIGKYLKTPFGLHRGPYVDVLSFCLKGQKRMVTWPYPYFDEKDVKKKTLPNGTVVVLEDPDPYLKDCNVLEYERGDVAYWPESHWHTGRQLDDSQLTMTVSLVYDQKSSYSSLISQLLAQGMSLSGLDDVFHGYWDTNSEAVPEDFAKRADWLKDLVASGNWDRLVEGAWQQIRANA